MDAEKLKDFLIPQRKHDRLMKEMTTKTENWRKFNDMKDVDQISQILSWLKSHGYDVDPNAKFDKPDPKRYLYGKNVKISGVNVQIYGVHNRPASSFRFMTRSKDIYHVDISNWATMYVGYHTYPDDPTNCIHKVDSFGPAEALECYIIL